MTDLEILVTLGMLAGLVGVLIPVLPGLPLIAGAALLWAIFGEVGAVGWLVVAAVVAIGIAGIVIAGTLPAKRSLDAGVPGWVLGVAAIGVAIGFFVIPVVGALVGGPIALFGAELVRQRDLRGAWRSSREALVGIGIGIGIQLGAGVTMVAVWLVGVAVT